MQPTPHDDFVGDGVVESLSVYGEYGDGDDDCDENETHTSPNNQHQHQVVVFLPVLPEK